MDIISDIDGTVADASHRLDFIRTKPKNWKAFFQAQIHDKVFLDIQFLLHSLKNSGCRIIMVTGRPELYREDTIEWLSNNNLSIYDKLYMRPHNDFREDDIIKEKILVKMLEEGYNPKLVLEDRDRVVAMWRRNGIRCLQVQDGNF